MVPASAKTLPTAGVAIVTGISTGASKVLSCERPELAWGGLVSQTPGPAPLQDFPDPDEADQSFGDLAQDILYLRNCTNPSQQDNESFEAYS